VLKAPHFRPCKDSRAPEASEASDLDRNVQGLASRVFDSRLPASDHRLSEEGRIESYQGAECSNRMLEGLSAKTYANVISMILPSGWQVLCDHFRKTYSADLPFVHFPTFLEFSTRIQHAIYTHDLNSSADKLDGLTFDSKVLLLSFLALTLRHCGVDFDKHKSIEGRDHDNLELSAQCARLALLSLANCSLRRHDETIRSVRARLMLAAYQWSVCWCTKARYLLSEAYLVGQEMNIVQEPCERHAQEPISVAMSFEAELLGVTVAQDVSHDRYLESDLETETVRRTFWSCHLLDLTSL
jgi:hypothetical protein